MFANPKWFKRRKYGGWGVTPDTKEGWLYILVVMSVLFISHLIAKNDQQRMLITGLWLVYLFFEVTSIMIKMPKDEREKEHEALAERNAAWAMLIVIVGGLIYQILTSAITQINQVDPIIVGTLLAGMLAKSATNWKLRKK